ncbi:MAG TPA: lipid-binding SYLF domain-containing protein [Dissulfurispiraceae bacterium]|nr:lipid-binding SYLF domain-containing protein [Dissulfurispiraceae bacterium]
MNRKRRTSCFPLIVIQTVLLIVLVAATGAPAGASDATDAQGLVDKARVTFNEMVNDNLYSWLRYHLKDAKGLLIYPQIIKGGFIVGGSGGTGVLVVRDEKSGSWSQPAFYTIGSVTLGLQIGGEASQVIVMAMSQKAIDSLLASSVKLGADASVAIGPLGGGAKENITADFISFAKSKGLYAGINLEGSVVAVREGLNTAYYGRIVSPLDIVIKKDVGNEGSKELRESLKKAAQ